MRCRKDGVFEDRHGTSEMRVVFFDVDDTLYDSSRQVETARRHAVKAMIAAGLEMEETRAYDALTRVVQTFGPNYPKHFNELLKVQGFADDPRVVASGVVAYHNAKMTYLVPFADTIDTLSSLDGAGYRLGVITNGLAVKQWEKLVRLDIVKFFDTVVISETTGMEKPDPGIFLLAAEQAGCRPTEAAMVGDRVDTDISGANRAGMLAIQLLNGRYQDRHSQLPEENPDYIISDLREVLEVLEMERRSGE